MTTHRIGSIALDESPPLDRAATLGVRAPDILGREAWDATMRALRLSKREAELVYQANYDESVQALASRLAVSANTVHTYKDRLYRKLGCNSLCQVLAIVFATQLVLLEESRRSSGMSPD